MPQISAGVLLFRRKPTLEVLLVHPGGPFWAKKDAAAWSVPKGLVVAGEDSLKAALREFEEETGIHPSGEFDELGEFRQPSSKRIRVWTQERDCDPSKIVSNIFALEWPPKSGRMQEFPEVDRAAWFDRAAALHHVHRGQIPIVEAFYNRAGGG